MKEKLLAACMAVVLGMICMTGCGNSNQSGVKQSGTSSGGETKNTLTFALATAGRTVSPITATEQPSFIIGYSTYESLVDYDVIEKDGKQIADATTMKGELAESWEESDDKLTYTFHLYQNIKFANGDPMTVDDVIYSLEAYKGTFQYNLMDIKEVNKKDDYTVGFVLNNQNVTFLQNLELIKIINKNEVEGQDDSYLDTHTAGSGKYVLESIDTSSEAILVANTNYWGSEKPDMEKITIKFIPEASNRTLFMQNGDIDICDSIQSKDIDMLSTNDSIEVREDEALKLCYFAMNSNIKPFDNPKVRQAVSSAVPYKALVDNVMQGKAFEMTSCMPSGMETSKSGTEDRAYPYDLDKAKELLKEAGYENGFEFTLTIPSGYQDWSDDAVMIQAELAKINVTMNINTVEYSTFIDSIKSEEGAQAFINMWTPYLNSPHYQIIQLFETNGLFNYAHYSNAEVDKLFEQIDHELDTSVSTPVYEQIQDIVNEDAPWAYLYQYKFYTVMKKELKGFIFYPNNNIRLETLYWE